MVLLAVFAGTFLLSVCSSLMMYTVYAADTGTVIGESVNIRSTPTTASSSNIITKLNTGDKVNILAYDVADTGGNTRTWHRISFTKDGKTYEGYIASEYVSIDIDYTPDMDFEEWLEEQGFPESYREGLRQIHAKYPQWVFVADHLDYSFDEVVKNQSILGRSLISINAISSWKSTKDEAYNWPEDRWYTFDGTKWNLASEEIVAFALDPRNYLDTTHIFAFELLSYNPGIQSEEGVNSIIAGSFMKETGTIGDKTLIFDDDKKTYTYAQALMMAGLASKVSPYHLATRIIQEVSIGKDGASASVTGTMAGYEGYYNYYNIKAFAADGRGAIENGLIYAKKMGWNTRLKAIIGGAQSTIGNNYIAIGQDTLYYEKFDFVDNPYTHQYMTYVMAPYEESVTAGKAYSESMRKDTKLVFKIPVFDNMPEQACALPTKKGSPNNILKHMAVLGHSMTPAYNYTVNSYNLIVPYETEKVNVYAAANVSSATVAGDGEVALEVGLNKVEVVCTAENGDKRTYTIDIYREEKKEDEPVPPTFTTTLKADVEKGFLSGIDFNTTAQQILDTCTYTGGLYGKVTDKDGREKNAKDSICTGDLLKIFDQEGNLFEEHPLVIYGDVDGNGKLDTYDFIYVRMHIRGTKLLSGCYLEAADADRKKDKVSTYDFIYIRMQIRGVGKINQH